MADNYSAEERRCESIYASTVSRNTDGRYIVRYPRVADFDILLGESKTSALRRFGLLERRLDRNPELKTQYHEFMQEYLSLNHMRLVDSKEERIPNAYY